jgi:hypothetical protein
LYPNSTFLEIVIFAKINDEVASTKTKGEIVTIAKNGEGKYKIVGSLDKRSNEGLKPVREFISTSLQTPLIQEESDIEDDLDLPPLLTDQSKKNLHNLAVERGRLLTHCIEIMAKELDSKGMEVYESSAKSLGISLFIHISKYLK